MFGYGTVGSSYTTGTYVQFVNGQATSSYFAPVYAGTFSANATLTSDASIATALQGKALSYSTTIVNPQSVVNDSTTVAAQAAATAAQTSADNANTASTLALGAVQALSNTVAAFIASITKQLASLAAVVAKIQKKLGVK